MPRPNIANITKYAKDKELVDLLASPPKQLCPVGMMLRDHPNVAEIQAALDNPKWSAAQLAPVLSKKVSAVSSAIVSQHRNETCVCSREA